MSFEAKACWITGASSGIGAALARELAGRGAHVILSGRDRTRLEQVAADCRESLVLPFDVRDEQALAAAAEQAHAWKGGIDLAIANAGVSQRSRALKTSLSVYREVIEIDLIAQIAFIQSVIGPMVERGSGSLAFMSSVAGKVGVPMRTAYCAAKFGLSGYADALRAELSQTGVAVQVIYSGPVQTAISTNALTGDGAPRGRSDSDIDNGFTPEEAARMMVDALARGEREIFVARGFELELGEARRTPDALLDKVAEGVAAGYMERMENT